MLTLLGTKVPTQLQAGDEIGLQHDVGGNFIRLWRDHQPLLVRDYDKIRLHGAEGIDEMGFSEIVYLIAHCLGLRAEVVRIEANEHFLAQYKLVAK